MSTEHSNLGGRKMLALKIGESFTMEVPSNVIHNVADTIRRMAYYRDKEVFVSHEGSTLTVKYNGDFKKVVLDGITVGECREFEAPGARAQAVRNTASTFAKKHGIKLTCRRFDGFIMQVTRLPDDHSPSPTLEAQLAKLAVGESLTVACEPSEMAALRSRVSAFGQRIDNVFSASALGNSLQVTRTARLASEARQERFSTRMAIKSAMRSPTGIKPTRKYDITQLKQPGDTMLVSLKAEPNAAYIRARCQHISVKTGLAYSVVQAGADGHRVTAKVKPDK